MGVDNPVFGATWRVIDQARAPVSVDVTGTYTPDIFPGIAALRDETGTLASGGQAGAAEIAVSRQMQILTPSAYGQFTYFGRRNERTDDGTEDYARRLLFESSWCCRIQTGWTLIYIFR